MIPLPKGLAFLELGWWVVHVIGVMIVYQWGYTRGQGEERRRQRERELAKGGR
jgi:hypothetical protein